MAINIMERQKRCVLILLIIISSRLAKVRLFALRATTKSRLTYHNASSIIIFVFKATR